MNNIRKLPTILVIDDEPVILETFKAIFEERFEVLAAASGARALEIISTEQVDLIFLDINIPDTSGIEILRMIKERNSGLPVILVTATANAALIEKARKLGIDGYIAKPFDMDKIIALAYETIKKKEGFKAGISAS